MQPLSKPRERYPYALLCVVVGVFYLALLGLVVTLQWLVGWLP